MKKSQIIGLSLLLITTAVIASATSIAFAATRGFAPPTAVAKINLTRVLEGLNQRAAAEQAVNDMRLAMSSQDEQRQRELRQLQEGLAELSGEALRTAEDELAMKMLQYQAWLKVSDQQLDVESSLQLRALYRSIRNAVESLAEAEGYDLVVVDDSSSEFALNPQSSMSRQMQVRQQIIGRRVLYGRDAIDITDQLIVRMNNAWEAGR